jgi:hypothetical protein
VYKQYFKQKRGDIMKNFTMGDKATVTFFNKDTRAVLYQGEVKTSELVVDYKQVSERVSSLGSDGLSLEGSFTLTNRKRLMSYKNLALILFANNVALHEKINYLETIEGKTKSRRIKKKQLKRVQQLFKQGKGR